MSTSNLTPLPAKSGLSAAEQLAKAASCSVDKPQLACQKTVNVGVFFDGTNNNDKRDRSEKGHSNIAKLYSSHRDDPREGFYRLYIPGVGTAFEEIGELTESSEGKAYAKGGDSRIAWALIQVLNSIRFTFDGRRLLEADEAKAAIKDTNQLATYWALSNSKRQAWFKRQVKKLEEVIVNKKPKIVQLNVSVFGFSRGAAEARAFCHWLVDCCEGNGTYLAGVPIKIQFLGIFDTVASVGLADSFPIPVQGLMDWADGSMEILPQVQRCVHYVAANEIRASFPLSCARNGKSYPANVLEQVFPGAHSNIGGGYGPGEQGRSKAGIEHLLSNIPLLNMYREAVKAGVPLKPLSALKPEIQQDFKISEPLRLAFNAYVKYSAIKTAKVEDMLDGHMRFYRRYKAQIGKNESKLINVKDQDKLDLDEASKDFERDAAKIRLEALHYIPDYDLKRIKNDYIDIETILPNDVLDFFLQYVHDSHAGFYLAGAVTKYDKEMEKKRVKAKAKALSGLYNIYYKPDYDNPMNTSYVNKYKLTESEYINNQLTKWERKVLACKGSDFPLMSDQDQWDMLQGMGVVVRANTTTRREGSGYFRRRNVFDKS
ncbi:DUF2235 domain-containing protein [Iodobacter sp. HSC-16F04]|uniref:DUF2235 domain-containing protein n=1 Tax=Iodobacter violaceini TaxID=3044271 RepID=A0ABX0L2Q7_9NEIS|nr:DUF2235 domain-containing protein [Iodobacter violacea]NHQ88484.1 DUF2235 domain-containing protein [Iodobacter violacea]